MTREFLYQHMNHEDTLRRLVSALEVVTDEAARMDISARVCALRMACEDERGEITRYACEIADGYVRAIFLARYKDAKTWGEIADKLGGGNTADSVRKACERGIDVR